MWKEIKGYKWPYRVNEDGVVQKFYREKWVTLNPYIHGERAMVKMRSLENKKMDVPVVWLMADAFMGGRRPGMNIVHKDGCKLNNCIWNLKFETKRQCGKRSSRARSRPVLKVAPDGTVVEIFRSGREAARREYVSQNAINVRCLHRVKDPYLLTGYTYEYEDNRKPGRPKK